METLFTTILSSTNLSTATGDNQSFEIYFDDETNFIFASPSGEMKVKDWKYPTSSSSSTNFEISFKSTLFENAKGKVDSDTWINLLETSHYEECEYNHLHCQPLKSFFDHQMYHMAVQKRFATSLDVNKRKEINYGKQHMMTAALNNCCQLLAYKSLADDYEELCLCASHFQEDRFCKSHSLMIKKMTVNEHGSSWIIGISDDDDELLENAICSPMNTSLENDLLYDNESICSLEIDFNSSEFAVQLNIDCEKSDFIVYSDNDLHKAIDTPCAVNVLRDVAEDAALTLETNNTELSFDYVLPKKKVRFKESTVHFMFAWSHAYRESRRGSWTKLANDRAHFNKKIQRIGKIVEPMLQRKLSEMNKDKCKKK